jgi:saccharopine dehydrogenase-like NADP-dependent oxidoreductase
MIMRKVLILGAGMVVKPMVTYLLGKDIRVTVATRTKSKAEALILKHPGGEAVEWTTEDEAGLDKMIAGHDITVSLLPWKHHLLVAGYCLKHRKNMVTTSYVQPEMKALDSQARERDIIILNELGLDPGIDHMSAMRIIDNVQGRGGKIEGFYSMCGALPAPGSADNPFRYKFSWSPRGVIAATGNDGRFLRNGEIIMIPAKDLFKNPLRVDFHGIGPLEVYPNRDSLPYIDLYGIPETRTMVRGTFRYPGWCEIMDAMKSLGLFSGEKRDFAGSYAGFMADILSATATRPGLKSGDLPLQAMQWLGLFDSRPLKGTAHSAFDIVAELMIEK